jgi:Flp pilus assembly protein CpaB
MSLRPRTFILLIVVLLVAALAFLLFLANRSGGSFTNLLPGNNGDSAGDTAVNDTNTNASTESGDSFVEQVTATPAATATLELVPVVIAKVRIPVGEFITPDLLTTEMRPTTNIALRGEYTFTDTAKVEGIARVEIARGQEILEPMLVTNPYDIGSFGSDLALHIPPSQVAIAIRIDTLSGVALAMRPGDTLDILMTLRTIEIDPEFRSALPNTISPVIESALLSGQQFIFGEFQEGRLEFVSQINQVAVIGPGSSFEGERPFGGGPIPKRVTQLSIQSAKVLWVGQWQDPRLIEQAGEGALANAAATSQAEGQPLPSPTPLPSRFEESPEIIILSMNPQDALTLKWAREHGVDITLALRHPNDKDRHQTTSVSLPQMIDQGSISIPEPINFDIYDGD